MSFLPAGLPRTIGLWDTARASKTRPTIAGVVMFAMEAMSLEKKTVENLTGQECLSHCDLKEP